MERLDRLRQAIGDPADYINTGVIIDDDTFCPCGQAIKHRYEIQHIETGELKYIGSVCAKRIGISLRRRCPLCKLHHRCHTTHCAKCRLYCYTCGEYHATNEVHKKTTTLRFRFGKHFNKHPDELLGVDDQYLIWIVNQRTWNETQRQYIIDNLLGDCCQSRFKRYPNTPLRELKRIDPKYFEYMKSTDTGCYLSYV